MAPLSPRSKVSPWLAVEALTVAVIRVHFLEGWIVTPSTTKLIFTSNLKYSKLDQGDLYILGAGTEIDTELYRYNKHNTHGREFN